jgi:hypothetical protein
MSKVLKLKNDSHSLVIYLKKLLEMAENGEIDNILIAALVKNNDGDRVPEVLTRYYKLNDLEKQYLIGSLQTDLNYNVVKANVNDLIEYVE